MPWWGWAILAWIAFDAIFAIAWTMRARVRERDAIERRFDQDLPVDAGDDPAADEGPLDRLPLDPRPRRSP